MAKILGLDLGTNSIGWAVVDEENESAPILEKGVRIFSEGVKIEKGVESSKASERTTFRSARRIKYRRKLRKIETLKVLIDQKMCPLTLQELDSWKKDKIYPENEAFKQWYLTDIQADAAERKKQIRNPYFFRNLVSTEKLDLSNEDNRFMLGRALYHLAQRRGFKSNRLDQSEADESQIESIKPELNLILEKCQTITDIILNFKEYLEDADASDEDKLLKNLYRTIDKFIKFLQKGETESVEIEKAKLLKIINKEEKLGAVKQSIKDLSNEIKSAGCETLGQYFYKLFQENGKIRDRYTHREDHYEHEFSKICEVQSLPETLKTQIRKAIFFQRPLRSQKGSVGKCTFEPSKPRCAVSHPLFELYRMLSFVNNIRWHYIDNEADKFNSKFGQTLDFEQKNLIVDLFFRPSKAQFDFKEIREKLEKSEKKKIVLNYPDHTTVSGCPMSAKLKNIFFEKSDWSEFSFSEKINFYKIPRFPNIKTNSEEHLFVAWNALFSFEDEDNLKEFAVSNLGLSDKEATAFTKIQPKQGYENLSVKAIRKILPYLEQGEIYSHAVYFANMPTVVGDEIWAKSKDEIIAGIKKIIENHTFENSRLLAVNGLLKTCYDNHWTFSVEAEPAYRKDIEHNLKANIGTDKWTEISDKNTVIEKSYHEFVTKLNDRKYATVRRTDEKIRDFLKGENSDGVVYCSDENKLKKIYHPSDIELYKQSKDGKLGSPRTESVRNPVVMKTLHQLRKQVNALLREGIITRETPVHVELAREMNDANMRNAIEIWQKSNEKKRNEFKKQIREDYFAQTGTEIEPTDDEITKYQLWEDQNHICIYTGKTIGVSDFVGPNPLFDIEHTLPRSLSYDNSIPNKTLCYNRFNREIKKQKLPSELENFDKKHVFHTSEGSLECPAILPVIAHWKEKATDAEKRMETARKISKGAATKDAKDNAIVKKHLAKMEFDYWNEKYKRFTMPEIKSGFKSSQLNDTRTISKLATAYLKSVFSRVHTVNGGATAWMREAWGLDNKKRDNHTHHTKDAVVVACMNKSRTTKLETYLEEAERENLPKPKIPTPWTTFYTDVKAIENDTLVFHVREDNAVKPAKKKLRKRGKIQYRTDKNGKFILDENGEKQPIYLQGDSIRGSLHKDTVYGAVKPNNSDDVKYVVRKKLEFGDTGFKTEKDLEKIVDKTVVEMINHQIIIAGSMKKALEDGVYMLKPETENGKVKRDDVGNAVFLRNENGELIKDSLIKKVRIYTPDVTTPLHIKQHRDVSKHEYKQEIHVKNDQNYLLAVYQGLDKKNNVVRTYELVNLLDTAKLSKFSSKNTNKQTLVPENSTKGKLQLPLAYILKTGMSVLFYENTPEELSDLEPYQLRNRFYKITQFEGDGRIQLRFHQEARQDKDLQRYSAVDFTNPKEKLRLALTNFNALIEGRDFTLTETGTIKWL